MDIYTPTYEHIILNGCKEAITWIVGYLCDHSIDFEYDGHASQLSFVQACYEHETTPIQDIIMDCPSTDWDIVSQFSCGYSSILSK